MGHIAPAAKAVGHIGKPIFVQPAGDKGRGCERCSSTGYKGRVGIYQVMPMTEEIQEIVLAGGNAMQIAEAAKRAGVNDLRQSALQKVRDGVTSLTEINRVTKD